MSSLYLVCILLGVDVRHEHPVTTHSTHLCFLFIDLASPPTLHKIPNRKFSPALPLLSPLHVLCPSRSAGNKCVLILPVRLALPIRRCVGDKAPHPLIFEKASLASNLWVGSLSERESSLYM